MRTSRIAVGGSGPWVGKSLVRRQAACVLLRPRQAKGRSTNPRRGCSLVARDDAMHLTKIARHTSLYHAVRLHQRRFPGLPSVASSRPCGWALAGAVPQPSRRVSSGLGVGVPVRGLAGNSRDQPSPTRNRSASMAGRPNRPHATGPMACPPAPSGRQGRPQLAHVAPAPAALTNPISYGGNSGETAVLSRPLI